MESNFIFKCLLGSLFFMGFICMTCIPASADCSVEETLTGSLIICSDSILDEITGTSEKDDIRILSDASLLYHLTESGDNLAEVTLVGINVLQGDDKITNEGDIAEIQATAETTAVGVSWMIDGIVEGGPSKDPLSDSSATADASATGIDGGAGSDTINNWADIFADAQAVVTATDVVTDITITSEGNVSGTALSDASITTNAAAAGIDGAGDTDFLNNQGNIGLIADSNATGVAVSLDIAGTMQGDAEGMSVSDASVTAASVVTGIKGEDGNDTIISDGPEISTDANASATAVSVGLTVSGSMEGNVEGTALSDGSATADALATGIDGGMGLDTIDNWSAIYEDVDAGATTVAVGLDVAVSIDEGGNASGAALSDASVKASAGASGIDGGGDSDEIDNRGDIELLANSDATGVAVSLDIAGSMKGDAEGSSLSDASVTARSVATGINGGEGDDTIENEGMITLMNGTGDDAIDADATAVSVGLTVSGSMEGNAEGEALSDSSATADAVVVGIAGGSGIDIITNREAIVGSVDTSATAVGVAVDIGITKEGNASGAALSDASVTSSAAASGIDGGEDSDEIDNRGDIELLANSDATGVAVSLDITGTMKGEAAGMSVSDASVTAASTVTGIEGGDGNDTIISDGPEITADVDASAIAVSVGLTVSGSMEGNVEGAALSDGTARADALAIGIDGGMGQDTIDNWSAIYEDVDAGATTVAVGLDVAVSIDEGGNASGAALSDASVKASAGASGIDGGGDSDEIDNRGDIELLANSDATGVAVSVDITGSMKGDAEGSSVSDASVTARSLATGIVGGEGDDTIDNEGTITLMNGFGDDDTDSSATAVSVNLTVSGSMVGNVAGEALSDSSALADAMVVGIDGGSGIDAITNRGAIVGSVDTSATAVGVGFDVSILIAKEGDVEGNVSGAALSDASVTANAAASGIEGGGDSDEIDNRGDIELSTSSDATGVAVSLDVAGSVAVKGGVEGEIAGKALSNASTEAYTETTGIDGGDESDHITNTGNISLLQAESDSTGVSASLNISAGVAANGDAKVNVAGEAVSDASVKAEAATSAIKGGSGNDEVINSGDFFNVQSDSTAIGVAASLDITGAFAFKGDADASTTGSAASAASTNALSKTVAIDGGAGEDIIKNTGDINNLISYSNATSVSAGANVSAVVAIKGNADADITGEAVGDSRVISRALALGLDGGLGNDEIDNEGDISLLSTADATGVAAELNVSAALSFKGVSTADVAGSAVSNSSVLAKAEATGIAGGWGQDIIQNIGNITVMNGEEPDADALGVSASLDISGNVAIKGVAAGTVEGAAASNATVTAEAAAKGIDGGGDNDIIDNTGAINLLPSSNAEGVSASLDVSVNMIGETEGSAMSDASVIARSAATGIDGGEGDDSITNEGSIILMKQDGSDQVDAYALGVAATLDISGNLNGTAEGEALSKTTTTADVSATGISGAGGTDSITNTGMITADVNSEALGVAAALGITLTSNGTAEGGALSDSSVTAEAGVIGIDGGEGDDTIANDLKEGSESGGDVELNATSDAESVAVSVEIAGTMKGAAEGKSVADASAKANSTATGLEGGSGEDDISNAANISASVDSYATAVGVSAGFTVSVNGYAEGAALNDVSAESLSSAIGINGADGNDTIANTGLLNLTSLSDSETTAVSVSLTGTMGGVAKGRAASDGSATALSKSIGIDGGQGDDVISNSTNKITTFSHAISDTTSVSVAGGGSIGLTENASVANASSISEAQSVGIDGGQGVDTVENTSEIEAMAKADAEATSTTVTVTIGVGSAESTGTGDSSATARATATGIEGGDDGDTIINSQTGMITVGASEPLGPMATAQAGATTVTVNFAAGSSSSESTSNAAAIAEVNAAAISGGSGDDWIENAGTITVGTDPGGTGVLANASGASTAVEVGITVGASLGKSSSDASSTAVANLAGIMGGSGNDTVYNSGSITVGRYFSDTVHPEAMAIANAASETVDVDITIGASFGDASSNASATAQSSSIGIATGGGDDWIKNENTGGINAFSSSEAVGLGKTTTATLTVGASDGSAQSNASTLSTAFATGIDSGDDSDEITTNSDMVVKAQATSITLSETENYNILSLGSSLQSADANSSSTAEAIGRGIDGGTGADIITVAGNYDVSADTLVKSTSRSTTVAGLVIGYNLQEAQSRAGTVSEALAVGIDGGEGNDEINSTANLMVNTVSSADTTATSSSNTGFNIAGASSGESAASASSDVTASGIGIRGGISGLGVDESDADIIINKGTIDVTTLVSAKTDSTSTADSITFIGKAEGKALSDASASVLADGIGIDGGADNDTITSTNTITVKSIADVSVTSTSNADSYAFIGSATSRGVSDASAKVLTEATGIYGGTGDDTITSHALVDVESKSIGSITATSNVNADVTFGSGSSEAASDTSVTKKGSATGIDGGDGSDIITNYKALNVKAEVAGAVTSKANADADATFGSTSSITTTAAALEGAVDTKGIIGGSGEDTITNKGHIDSIADATLYVKNSSVATAESTFGSSDARAFSVSTLQGKASSLGMSGDDGDDFMVNDGSVNVKAIANATVDSATVAIADSFWGSEYTEAASSNYAAGASVAVGVTAGTGNDRILNSKLISVETDGDVKIKSEVYSSDGPASSDARTMALAHASGIESGADDDYILNSGTVFVKSAPRIKSATRTFGMRGHTNGNVGIVLDAVAMGITAGEGNDTIGNEGNVLVYIGGPETDSTVSQEAINGTNTVTDSNLMGEDTEALEGKWIRIAGGENPDFFTQVVAFDPLSGQLTLRNALTFDLPSDATYTLYAFGNKTPDIELVQLTAGGRTQVDASTTAKIGATGIEGGDGDDTIMNSGAIDVKASNLIQTVSVAFSRDVEADSDTESTVNATGIAGDGQDDTSNVTVGSAGDKVTFIDTERIGQNSDTIVGKRIRFKTGESAGFFTIVQGFDPETGTFTLLDSIPDGGLSEDDIYILGGGSNWITNENVIDVAAYGGINATSWSLSFGNADIEASGRANARSSGVRGGEYDNFVENTSLINTRSTGVVLAAERVTAIFGGAEQELVFEAVSSSAGISTGAGDDTVVNGDDESAELAAINVDAVASAYVNGVTTTFSSVFDGSQETNNLVDARSAATAMGFDLGAGLNDAYNTGQISINAESTTTAKAISNFSLYDENNARANASASAFASGIRAEDGGDMIQSSGGITVDAKALADSEAQGSDVIGGSKNDINSAVTEDSDSGSITFIDASLEKEPEDVIGKYVRFLTGDNENFTTQVIGFDPDNGTIIIAAPLPQNLKALEVDDDGNIVTPADEYSIANGRDGESGAFANAFATGINLNNGLNNGNTSVEIEGTLYVGADAEAISTATTFYNGKNDASATAVAEARGIVAGDGNDVITNKGEINVTAIVTTGSNIGIPEERALATGIETGEGIDTIVNSGSIVTGIVLNGADPVAGIGILAGAGNDMVILDDGSSVTGDVDLGADDDTLYLIGSPVVNGALLPDGAGSPDSGIDSIVFEGAGSFVNPLDGFNRVTKQGAGTYTVPSLPTMQWLEVTEGTLETESDYNFAGDGMFQTNVYSNGTHGKLHVIGSSVIDGGLTVLRGQGAYVNATLYDIIEATDITGIFSNIFLPEPTILLSFSVGQPSNTVVNVEVNAESFTTVASNRVELAIAKHLDRITPTATGDMSNLIGEFQILSMSEFGAAFASLSPSLYDISTRTTYHGTQQYTTTLLKRMHSLQLTSASNKLQRNGASRQEENLLAYNGSTASIGQLYAPAHQKQAKYGVWLDGFNKWGDQDEDDGFPSYDYEVHGMTIGFDRMFRDSYIAGISIGYSDADIDVDSNVADGDIDAVYGSLYGSYYTRRGYIDGALSYGDQDYYNKRRVVIGPIQREARSDHDGDMFSAFIEGGYNFDVKPLGLQPFVSLRYINLDEEGFAEKGADSANLIINDRETESLVSELGLRVFRLYELNSSGTMIPELSVAWNYDFDIDDRIITAAFAGSPNSSFSMEGQHVKKNGITVGAGVTVMNKAGLTTSVKYNGEFRDGYSAHGIIGELRYEF